MKRYEAYKNSGVEWIGEIPEGWNVMRIKHLCDVTDGTHFSPKTTDVGKPYITVSNVRENNIDIQGALLISNEDFENLIKQGCQPHVGDVLLSKDGTVGRSAVVKDNNDFVCLSSLGILTPSKQTNSFFLKYMLDSVMLQDQMTQAMAGSALRRITISKINDFVALHPPLPEQRAIATYLDRKGGKIDASVAAINKQIDDLKAYRQSIISEAVTKGLNPNAKMKDSGVEWIGEVPEEWKCLRLRFVCELRNGYTPSKAIPEYWENGSIPWYRMDDIRDSGRRLNKAKQYITKEAVKGGGLFEAGSFILATTATIGEHAVLIVDSLANQRFTNLKIRKSLDATLLRDFFFYYLFVIDDYCKSTTNTSTFPAVNMELLKDCLVAFPSVEEQQNIADYLDKKCNQIASAITSLEQQREDLEALKQSVISETVTGKVDVRDWKPKNMEQ